MLHAILSKLPKPLDLDSLISRSAALHAAHPPPRLGGLTWFAVSRNSVLKTTRDAASLAAQTLADGERFFERHAADVAAQEARERRVKTARRLAVRYRRPALATGTAVLVAVVAVYLRRVGGVPPPLSVAGVYQAGLMLRAKALGLLDSLVR